MKRRRRRKSLIDVWSANLAKPDPKKGPPVNLANKLFPIKHSSHN